MEGGATTASAEVSGSHNFGPAAAAKAFSIEMVLERIAKYLLKKELQELRRTSSTLNHVFVGQLKTSGSGTVNLHAMLSKEKERCDQRGWQQLSQYTKLMQAHSGAAIPFTNYQIRDLAIADDQDLHDFFTVCGQSVRKLQLCQSWISQPTVQELDRIRRVLVQLTPQLSDLEIGLHLGISPWSTFPGLGEFVGELPNLKRLLVNSAAEPHAVWQKLLQDLIQHAPSLQNLELSGGAQLVLLTAVRDLAPKIGNLQIMHLVVGNGVSEISAMLEMTGLHLNVFGITFQVFNIFDNEAQLQNLFHLFLTKQSATLQHLELGINSVRKSVDWNDVRALRFPRMPELFRLHLCRSGPSGSETQWPVPLKHDEPSWALTIPKLKHISYKNCNKSGAVATLCCGQDLDFLAHDNVTELELNCHEVVDMARMAGHFPSVIRISFTWHSRSPSHAELIPIWTTWPQLDALRLCVPPSVNMDELLTGVPTENFVEVRRELEQPILSLNCLRRLMDKYKRSSGFSDLHSLRSFSLTCQRGQRSSGQCKFTDISGYLGLALCPTLQNLGIRCNAPRSQISEQCQALIRSATFPWAVVEIE